MPRPSAHFIPLCAALALATAASAGPLEDGLAAYQAKDYATALKLFEPLAEAGDPVAQDRLGRMYMLGRGVAADPARSTAWSRKAAVQGYGKARRWMALQCMDDKAGPEFDCPEASAWLKADAEAGDVNAQFELGDFYLLGSKTFPQNGAQSFIWISRAAQQGDQDAEQLLVLNYHLGFGGAPKDESQAFYWDRKLAGQGAVDAQAQVGEAYAKGLGVARDDVQAYAWFDLAASNGADRSDYHGDPVALRDAVAARLTAEQLAEAKRQAAALRAQSGGK